MSGEGFRPRIGVFDSGVGGLYVLSALLKELPRADYFYWGDNTHAPYGSRGEGEIVRFVRRALSRFSALGVDVAVLACNTASAVCLEKMREEFPFPIVGMEPAVAPAAKSCKNVLVLATPLTAKSDRLRGLVSRFESCSFTLFGAEGLAAAIEARFRGEGEIELETHLPHIECDGVVLGCTHYSFYAKEIGDFYAAPVFDGALGTAKKVGFQVRAGTERHRRPSLTPNNCLTYFCKKEGEFVVYFLDKCAKFNKQVFISERLF